MKTDRPTTYIQPVSVYVYYFKAFCKMLLLHATPQNM